MKQYILFVCIIIPSLSLSQSSDFEFVYSVNTSGVPDIYISSENLYIKNMIVDPPQKLTIKLKKDEKQAILNKLKEIDFYNYPSEYRFESKDSGNLISRAIPCYQCNITVYSNGE